MGCEVWTAPYMKELCCLPPLPLDAETGGGEKCEMEVDFVAGEAVAELLLGEVSTGIGGRAEGRRWPNAGTILRRCRR